MQEGVKMAKENLASVEEKRRLLMDGK